MTASHDSDEASAADGASSAGAEGAAPETDAPERFAREDAERRGRRRRLLAGVTALLFAAAVILASLFVFRTDRPALWPPVSRFLYVFAFAVGAGGLTIAFYMFVFLVASLAAAWLGKTTWRDFRDQAIAVAATVAIIVSTISISLKAFYWPWAAASASYTILADAEKWRIIAAAETLADHPHAASEASIRRGLSSPTPGVRAAAAYALAAAGEKTYLKRLANIASDLPPDRPQREAPSLENNIASQADALWLVARIVGEAPEPNAPPPFASLKSFEVWLNANTAYLKWNRAAKRYVLPAVMTEQAE